MLKHKEKKIFATLVTVPNEELKTRVRERLARDPAWAVYALGDLAPGHFDECRWYLPPAHPDAIALLYHGFPTPIFWAAGAPDAFDPLVDEMLASPRLILQIQPSFAPWLERRYKLTRLKPMLRMGLAAAAFRPPGGAAAERLTPAHLPALEDLYLDGEAAGEGPEFFFASMLEQGVFFGAWEEARLVAVAGTHIFSPQESAAAIGNVYTRRECRGRGLAGRLTGAVVAELLRVGTRTIALSVAEQNRAAIGVYERLGFARHCAFFEGFAER